jgi:hypothetical protein
MDEADEFGVIRGEASDRVADVRALVSRARGALSGVQVAAETVGEAEPSAVTALAVGDDVAGDAVQPHACWFVLTRELLHLTPGGKHDVGEGVSGVIVTEAPLELAQQAARVAGEDVGESVCGVIARACHWSAAPQSRRPS